MWSCRYHTRRPVEIMILARNPSPKSGEKFTLSQMKIWNFNKSINVSILEPTGIHGSFIIFFLSL